MLADLKRDRRPSCMLQLCRFSTLVPPSLQTEWVSTVKWIQHPIENLLQLAAVSSRGLMNPD